MYTALGDAGKAPELMWSRSSVHTADDVSDSPRVAPLVTVAPSTTSALLAPVPS
jgi:hypothetical protein